jgi:hypothetical protein
MRLALLSCAAALTFVGAAAAQAEMVYVTEPDAVATAPGYVYSVPGPLPGSRFVVTEHDPVVVAEPPVSYVVAPPARVINRPLAIAPREATTRVVPRESGIVTTGYSTVRSCFTDLIGVERCY